MNWFEKRKVKAAEKSAKTASEPNESVTQDAAIGTTLKGHVYDIEMHGVVTYYHSFVASDLILKYGLKGCVISGKVEKSEQNGIEDHFIANTEFKETVFKFVDSVMRQDPNLVQAAENQIDGNVYIIDQRTPDPNGRVEMFDILGAFEVENKTLGAFKKNANYQIKSVNGFIDFGPRNNAKFNAYLEGLLLSDETR